MVEDNEAWSLSDVEHVDGLSRRIADFSDCDVYC
jgi:hypothetical protein